MDTHNTHHPHPHMRVHSISFLSVVLTTLWLGTLPVVVQADGEGPVDANGYYHWPGYSPTLAYDYVAEYGPQGPPTEVLDDVDNVAGTYVDGWWCFRYGPNKNALVTSAGWIPLVQRFNEDFDYITNVMRWPRDLRARSGYYSTIYLYGSGLSTDNASNTDTGGWQSATYYRGQSWPMVLASYYPVHCFDPSFSGGDGAFQRGAMVHEGIHCILASMPGCKNSAWFHEGGNTWLQGTMESQRSGDFGSIGWLSAGAVIAPFMPIECYSGWLQDGSFGGPSAEGVNRYSGSTQLCTWRNLLGGTQYGECFPHALEVILGPQSIAWIWRNCDRSGRVLQDMAEAEGGLGDAQMRRLIQEYRARQAFCDFGSWSYAFMQLLNNNWRANIHAEYEPIWINCAPWTATCYVQTTASRQGLLTPEARTLPGWSGANQIPLKVAAGAASATVTFNPSGPHMSCQLVYRDNAGEVHYGPPVDSGPCRIPLSDVKDNVVVAVICNTDYIYEGDPTRQAKYDYTLTLGDGVTGQADIFTRWYHYTASRYTLTASAGAHGSISPSGSVSVPAGQSRSFTLTPDPGYGVESVAIDGVTIDTVTSYRFANVRGHHSIAVTFARPSRTLWASSKGAGTIEPAGEVRAILGEDQLFTITPAGGFAVCDVTVDGVSVGAVTSYTFHDVATEHVIQAEFCASGDGVPAAGHLVFSCVTGTLPASGPTHDWETYLPGGSSLIAVNTPSVTLIDGTKWVENLYDDSDGYRLDSPPSATRCNGATMVVAVRPLRHQTEVAWSSIVDVFYDNLVLGLNNQTGELQVWRNGTFYHTGVVIPDQQKTVLALVVQANGTFDIYANGVQVYTQSETDSFRIVRAGDLDYMQQITVGRNAPDAWSTFNGHIGDVFFYRKALSDTEREELETLLMSKFTDVAGP